METRQPRSTRRLREANVGKSREGLVVRTRPCLCARSVCVRVSISRRVMGLRVWYLRPQRAVVSFTLRRTPRYTRTRISGIEGQEKKEAMSESKWV